MEGVFVRLLTFFLSRVTLGHFYTFFQKAELVPGPGITEEEVSTQLWTDSLWVLCRGLGPPGVWRTSPEVWGLQVWAGAGHHSRRNPSVSLVRNCPRILLPDVLGGLLMFLMRSNQDQLRGKEKQDCTFKNKRGGGGISKWNGKFKEKKYEFERKIVNVTLEYN